MLDVHDLAPHLRQADRDELEACGIAPFDALHAGLQSEPCMTILHRGQPAVMFGVMRGPAFWHLERGAVWLLGSDAIDTSFALPFLRYSRAWLERIAEKYDLLYNVVDERNTVHIRWLKWLGFTFIARHEHFGVAKFPFLEFTKIT